MPLFKIWTRIQRRAMGRKEAAGSFDRKTGVCKRPGKVTPEMMQS
jgi:hypothetical protein